MKKIIATVLAMVMALALCTTAFAADSYKVVDLSNNTSTTYTTISTGKVSDTTTGGIVTKAGYDYYLVNSTYYAPAASGFATHRIYTNGKNPVDVIELGNSLVDVTLVLATYNVKDTAVNCGDETAKNTDASVFKITNVAADVDACYTDDSANTNWAILNGKLLKVNDAAVKATYVETKAHDFSVVANNVYTAGKLTSVKCKNCDVTAIYAKTIPAGYESVARAARNGEVYGSNNAASTYEEGFWYLSSGKAADNTNTNGGKDSPKTFDAGIAMYVGMALTSVAGSAVVIGKKKEF